MELLLAILILLAVAAFVSAPLRHRPGRGDRAAADRAAALDDLEARKLSKYREIRDAELDHASGKLSDSDHAVVEARLRAEAVEILAEIDKLGTSGPPRGD